MGTDAEKTYSVLMAVYGKEKPEFFRQSIESMLAQTLPFSDFVLVCDGALTHELNEVISWAQEELEMCIRDRSHPFSDNRNFECDGRFYADRSSRCRNLGDRNDSSNLDYCTLCLQTFPSSVYENAFWNNLDVYKRQVAKVIVEEGVKVVTTGAGSPEKYMADWKAAGVKVIPVVASVALAKRMERCGADAVVAEGTEAGGHRCV